MQSLKRMDRPLYTENPLEYSATSKTWSYNIQSSPFFKNPNISRHI